MVRFFLLRASATYLFLLSVLCCVTSIPEGFVADTLVRIPTGYAHIQDLSVGDKVLVSTFNEYVASEAITKIISHEIETIIRVNVDGDIIDMAENQLFFVPLQQRWVPVSQIHEGMYLLSAPLRAVRVKSVSRIEQKTQVYAFSLNKHHNYLVGQHNIVVHNFGPMVFGAVQAAEGITLLNVFLAANPLVAPVTIAVGGAGLIGGLIWKAIGEIKESKKSSKKDKSSGGQPEDPKKPKNNDAEPDPATVRAAAIALLKAIEESRDKAIEVFNKTYEWITTTENGLQAIRHAFENRPKHNFGPLLTRMGANLADKKDVLRVGTKILADVTQKLIAMGSKLPLKDDGVYYNILVEYGGEIITTRGRIIDGIFKMSTMFIQPQHVR